MLVRRSFHSINSFILKKMDLDFPNGPVVKNLPASEAHRVDFCSRKILHTTKVHVKQLLSP